MPVLPVSLPIAIDVGVIEEFCSRWKIAKLELFGSALRPDFRDDSDLDLLVTFAPEAAWGLFERVSMQEEISGMLDRKVDLVSRRAIERSRNWIRQRAILGSAIPFYVAR